MTMTIYAEASICRDTKAAGWGIWVAPHGKTESGVITDECSGASMAELAAAERAIAWACRNRADYVIIGLRSTTALAVLRWALPGAVVHGDLDVEPAKRVEPAIRDFPPLQDIIGRVKSVGIRVDLILPRQGVFTKEASKLARAAMETDRAFRRGASRR